MRPVILRKISIYISGICWLMADVCWLLGSKKVCKEGTTNNNDKYNSQRLSKRRDGEGPWLVRCSIVQIPT
jgi:hypothetical protein